MAIPRSSSSEGDSFTRLHSALDDMQVPVFSLAAVASHKEEMLSQALLFAPTFALRRRDRPESVRRIAAALHLLDHLCKATALVAVICLMMFFEGSFVLSLAIQIPTVFLCAAAARICGRTASRLQEGYHAIIGWTITPAEKHNDIPEAGLRLMAQLKRIFPDVEYYIHRLGVDPLLEARLPHPSKAKESAIIFGFSGPYELMEHASEYGTRITYCPDTSQRWANQG